MSYRTVTVRMNCVETILYLLEMFTNKIFSYYLNIQHSLLYFQLPVYKLDQPCNVLKIPPLKRKKVVGRPTVWLDHPFLIFMDRPIGALTTLYLQQTLYIINILSFLKCGTEKVVDFNTFIRKRIECCSQIHHGGQNSNKFGV